MLLFHFRRRASSFSVQCNPTRNASHGKSVYFVNFQSVGTVLQRGDPARAMVSDPTHRNAVAPVPGSSLVVATPIITNPARNDPQRQACAQFAEWLGMNCER